MARRATGMTKTMWFPKTASVTFNDGDFVALSSGYIIDATSSTTKILGVVRRTSASTDTDYALTTSVPVQVPIELFVEWEVTTASATQANIGVAYDLTNATTVNLSGTTYKVVTPTKVISATDIFVVINPAGAGLA